jgi:phage-related minor tail protein
MSIDVATLVFEFKSDSAGQAEKAMDRLIAKGDQLDVTARKVRTATDRMNDGHAGAAGAAQRASQGAAALAASNGALEKAQERAARAAEVMVRKVNAIEKALSPAAAVTLTMAERTATLNKALASGAISAERHAVLTTKVAGAATAGAAGIAKYGAVTRETSGFLRNLSFQLNDVFTGIASGQRPFQILAQQGGQIFQAFQMGPGGVGGSFRALLGLINPVVAGVVLLAGALGVVAVAAFKGAGEVDKLNGSLIKTGGYAGVTAENLHTLARSIADSSDTTIGSTKKTLAALVDTGRFGKAAIVSLADAAQNYAHITGTNADQFVKEYATMKDHLVQFAVAHEDVYHDLTLAQIRQIELLVKHGQEAQAQELLAKLIDDASRERLKQKQAEEEANFGFLERSLKYLTQVASNFWDALLGIGRPKTLTDALTEATTKLAADTAAAGNPSAVKGSPAQQAARAAALAHDRQVITNLQAELAIKDQATQAQAKAAQDEHNRIQKVFGDGKPRGGKGPRDASEQAIDAAIKAEISARTALTHNVEEVARLKFEEIEAERKAATDRVERGVKEGSVTKAAGDIAIAKYAEAAASKKVLATREEEAAIAQRELTQRQAIASDQDKLASLQAASAGNATQQAAIEAKAMDARQALDRAILAERTKQQVIWGEITEFAAQELALSQVAVQQAEKAQAAEAQRVRIVHEAARASQDGLENQLDLAASQADLVLSMETRVEVERRILDLQQQIALSKANEAIAAAVSGSEEQRLARERLKTLGLIQKNERKAFESQNDNVAALNAATNALGDFTTAFKSHDWGRALGDLANALTQLSGPSGLTAALAGLGAIAALSQAINPSIASALGLDKKQQKNAGNFGLLGALVLGKASNHGAGIDLATGQLSGGKRNDETETAARAAAAAITAAQNTLRDAGITLGATVTGLVLGSRDLSQIYLSNGRTLTSAVGDVQAAAEAALRGVLQDATYASDAQKTLVESMVAAGKGFDDITAALAAFAAAQSISGGIADQILKLTDPKAFDIQAVHRDIEEQRKAARAAAEAGYLTADQLTGINGQFATLEGLRLDEVMKRYTNAVDDAAAATADLAAIAATRRDLEIQFMEASGNGLAAQLAREADVLASLDPSLRALQQSVFDMVAANDRVTAATSALDAAKSALSEAYQRDAGTLRESIDAFSSVTSSLQEYASKLRLAANDNAPLAGYASTKAAFQAAAAAVRANPADKAAYAKLQGAGDAFLDASKATARTQLDYNRDLAAVRREVTDATALAQNQVDVAQASLDQLTSVVGRLIELNGSVLAIPIAIAGVQSAMVQLAAATAQQQAVATGASANDNLPGSIQQYIADNKDLRRNWEAGGSLRGAGATLEEAALAHYRTTGQYEIAAGLRKFAAGGWHPGGMRLVGEEGPEIETTGPARYFSAKDTARMMGGGNDSEAICAELRALRQEVAQLRGSADKTAQSARSMDERQARQEFQGIYARGELPGEPVATLEAA